MKKLPPSQLAFAFDREEDPYESKTYRQLLMEQIRRDTDALREGVICPDREFYEQRIESFRAEYLRLGG